MIKSDIKPGKIYYVEYATKIHKVKVVAITSEGVIVDTNYRSIFSNLCELGFSKVKAEVHKL